MSCIFLGWIFLCFQGIKYAKTSVILAALKAKEKKLFVLLNNVDGLKQRSFNFKVDMFLCCFVKHYYFMPGPS